MLFFAGVFGIEVLVKKVVDQILEQTKPLEKATPEASEPESEEPKPATHASGETASKIIVTGINVGNHVHQSLLVLCTAILLLIIDYANDFNGWLAVGVFCIACLSRKRMTFRYQSILVSLSWCKFCEIIHKLKARDGPILTLYCSELLSL